MKAKVITLVVSFLIIIGVCGGCSQSILVEIHDPAAVVPAESDSDLLDISLEMVPLTDTPAMFTIPVPAAPGTNVKKNEKAEIDYSNDEDGYVMIRYLKKTDKDLRVIVTGPSKTKYIYTLKSNGEYEAYPFSDGNGTYSIGVYEWVTGNKYATANTLSVDVSLKDEFAPFIRPNQYINYNKDSAVVKKAAEITRDSKDTTEELAAIYNYVVNNISYDKQLAATVKAGYLPDVDKVLKSGKGICFDYAAVMAAMLRSQDIPAKLVVGYTGEIYHAWISAYSKESGWIDAVIYLEGKTWKLMDPTFASTGKRSAEVMKYIGDGSNYTAKYIY